MFKKTLLINKHGDEFTGWSEYSFKPATGELIFNTAMTGFVEILSDPSYINQIVTFTSSHVGNYGLSEIDFESNKPKIEAAVGNTFSHSPSSWRSQKALTSWLVEYEIPFSGGFDVRAITKYLRDRGTSMYALGVDIDKNDLLELLNSATNILGDDSALTAGNLDISSNAPEGKVGILDLGAKKSIVNVLENLNYQVVAIKPESSAEDILSMNLKGLLISNGPGDPRSLINVIKTINNLIGKIPIFGICLGHQILSLACGLKVNKLEFGHHGSNHPVKIKGIKKALITAQNHGFAVEEFGENLVHKDFGNIVNYATNLNDGSNEGISLWDSMAYSVQFHPESGPGTSDGLQIFNPFVEMMEEQYAKK
jgi:carbamoyl-phosphate synthase small subunit